MRKGRWRGALADMAEAKLKSKEREMRKGRWRGTSPDGWCRVAGVWLRWFRT